MLKDWVLNYDRKNNKWRWVDTRVFQEPETERQREKNGFYPYEFDFLEFVKGSVSQCSYCGKFQLVKTLTRDHVYPKSKGGQITTPACRPCNNAKRDLLPIDFAVWYSETGQALSVMPIGFDPENP